MISLLTFVLRVVVSMIILLFLVLVVTAIWWVMLSKGLTVFNAWTGGSQNGFVQIFNVAGTLAFIVTTLFMECVVILVALLGLRTTWE